jgi:hypothetical protein
MDARLVRSAMVTFVLSLAIPVSGAACLDRPVVAGEPTTKTDFTTKVSQTTVDKVDLLFSIDNSASMGDKQAYLEQAIPDLITRLLTPNCVDPANPAAAPVPSTLDGNGNATCTGTAQLEFPAVHDLHIGVVSSSLGPRLGDVIDSKVPNVVPACVPATVLINGVMLDRHNDDAAHLLTRSSTPGATDPTEVPLPDASSGFLAWFPSVSANVGKDAGTAPIVTDPTQLETDFKDLIAGVHEYGCGIESQLESWYRFLIQPDPYATLAVVGGAAQWVGVDTAILKQRHDFLRPDSLVAVIVLSDENDSEIDVRSYRGSGYAFMAATYEPARGTQACATNPADPSCGSCSLAANAATDPSCTQGVYASSDVTNWGSDLNLRHVHMKAKYGVDPQFPITRYVNGLTSPTVPDRIGEYPTPTSAYAANNDCTNPLFAASLPDGTGLSAGIATAETASDVSALCNLPASSRPKENVFYAIIGGVPNQLLHFDQASGTNAPDWVRILGKSPDTFDYTGIDVHMVESYAPRVGLSYVASPLTGETVPTDPTNGNGAANDPWNGREWITDSANPVHVDLPVDRQYACTFKLAGPPRDCSNSIVAGNRVWTVPANSYACDCSTAGATPGEVPPVCDPATPTNQIAAKAYPTIRELNLADKLGAQGIVSSICPIDVEDNSAGNDPLYGYRPAVAAIINRLKTALTNACLPQKLTPNPDGSLPCLILATLPSGTQAECGTTPGLSAPDQAILQGIQQTQDAEWVAGGSVGPQLSKQPTCEVSPVPASALVGGTCKTSTVPGWCYVTGSAAGACDQEIVLSPDTVPSGAIINMQCLESSNAIGGAASDGG